MPATDTRPVTRDPSSWKSIPIGAEAIDPEQRLVSGFISTTDVDMIGDVVLPEGMDENSYFAGTRSVNLEHDPEAPVGTNRNLSKRYKGVWATTYVGRHALGEDVLTMLREGVIRGMSIEWDPRSLESSPPTADEKRVYGPRCKRVFRRWTLTRYAFTAQPMNPYCLVDSVKSAAYLRDAEGIWARMEEMFTKGMIHRSSAVAAGFPDTPGRRAYPVTGAARRQRTVKLVGGCIVRA